MTEAMAHPTRPYTTTHTGRHISPEGGEPSILDIAMGASRITRFAGQGTQFFSVLAHMMWMDDLYQERLANPDKGVRLAILLHDAHESVTSDIPSPLKTGQQKGLQHLLDQRIFDRYFAAFGGWKGYDTNGYAATVKVLDYRTLIAEFWEIGPRQACYLEYPPPEDRDFLRFWLEKRRPLWADEEAARNEYITRLVTLI